MAAEVVLQEGLPGVVVARDPLAVLLGVAVASPEEIHPVAPNGDFGITQKDFVSILSEVFLYSLLVLMVVIVQKWLVHIEIHIAH